MYDWGHTGTLKSGQSRLHAQNSVRKPWCVGIVADENENHWNYIQVKKWQVPL